MRFVGAQTILLLVTLVLAVMVPMFVGHGLASHENGWILAGAGVAVVTAVLMFLLRPIETRG